MTKRICSLLLTLCLIFSLSTFAFATNGAHKTVDYIAQDWIDTQFSGDAEVSDRLLGIHQRRKICENTIWLDKLSHLFEVQAEFS